MYNLLVRYSGMYMRKTGSKPKKKEKEKRKDIRDFRKKQLRVKKAGKDKAILASQMTTNLI